MRWAEADVTASADRPGHTGLPDAPHGALWTGSMADRPLPLSPRAAGRRPRGRIEAASQRMKIVLCGVGRGNWY
jgi:hypothetical protein